MSFLVSAMVEIAGLSGDVSPNFLTSIFEVASLDLI